MANYCSKFVSLLMFSKPKVGIKLKAFAPCIKEYNQWQSQPNNLVIPCNKRHAFCFFFTCLGVKKGDRVAIYLPMIIELVIAMLACARIGAIHSIVVD